MRLHAGERALSADVALAVGGLAADEEDQGGGKGMCFQRGGGATDFGNVREEVRRVEGRRGMFGEFFKRLLGMKRDLEMLRSWKTSRGLERLF